MLGGVMTTVGEFFCGAGGMGLGAKQAGFEHKFAIDYEFDAVASFSLNVSRNVLCADIKEVDIKELPYVDGFMYGFPCNDFSILGDSKGLEGSFGGLYSYGVEYLNLHSPKFFVAENVGGISSVNEGEAFKKILADLGEAGNGYTLTVHKYKFEEYGIPQKRHRFVIVGMRSDLGLKFEVPEPSGQIVTAGEALACIPSWVNNHEFAKHPAKVVERLSYIKPGENVWQTHLPEHLMLKEQLEQKQHKAMSNRYRKTHPNKPAYTVTASGGGGTHGYHWEDRALTNRERARFQTFPDWFTFVGGKESVRKQIGMAVPVLGARIILEEIRGLL
jgi:DNA (cytosine-5)-methyltransferase 1